MARTVNSFIMTSADDCKCTLQHCTAADLPLLREAHAVAYAGSMRTKMNHIASRIRQLEKEAANG